MKRISRWFLILATAFVAGCADETEPKNSGPSADRLFLQYRLVAEEGREDATVTLEFKYRNQNGRAMLLEEPATVELDGIRLEPDSSSFSGVFYEKTLSSAELAGNHKIRLTAADGSTYEESFEFRPFSLAPDFPDTISRGSFYLELTNPPADGEILQLILVDTSFESPDVNDDVEVRDGKIEVTPSMLKKVVNGPIILEIHQEKNETLDEPTKAGGSFSLFYAVKREFELKD